MYKDLTKDIVSYLKSKKHDLTSGLLEVSEKTNPADMVTNLDIEIEKRVIEIIRKHDTHAIFLAEESHNDTIVGKDYWTIDPIDGTSNLTYGVPYFSTAISHVVDDEVQYAITYYHSLEELYYYNKQSNLLIRVTDNDFEEASFEIKHKSIEKSVGFVGTQPYDKGLRGLTMQLNTMLLLKCADIRRMGCASLDIASVAFGKADFYVEGGIKPWDIAGGMAMVRHTGGYAKIVEVDNGIDKYNVIVAAQDVDVYKTILEVVRHVLCK